MGAELLTEERVVGMLLADQGAKDGLDLPVSVSDRLPWLLVRAPTAAVEK
jgi:hypothetical protein